MNKKKGVDAEKTFIAYKGSRTTHMRVNTPVNKVTLKERDKPHLDYQCRRCDSEERHSSLEAMKYSHASPECYYTDTRGKKVWEYQISCRLCNRTYSTRKNAMYHLKRVHYRVVRYHCPNCLDEFYGKRELVVHKARCGKNETEADKIILNEFDNPEDRERPVQSINGITIPNDLDVSIENSPIRIAYPKNHKIPKIYDLRRRY